MRAYNNYILSFGHDDYSVGHANVYLFDTELTHEKLKIILRSYRVHVNNIMKHKYYN